MSVLTGGRILSRFFAPDRCTHDFAKAIGKVNLHECWTHILSRSSTKVASTLQAKMEHGDVCNTTYNRQTQNIPAQKARNHPNAEYIPCSICHKKKKTFMHIVCTEKAFVLGAETVHMLKCIT